MKSVQVVPVARCRLVKVCCMAKVMGNLDPSHLSATWRGGGQECGGSHLSLGVGLPFRDNEGMGCEEPYEFEQEQIKSTACRME